MYNHYYGPWSARLQAQNRGSTRGGWVARYRNTRQWLQVDLGTVSLVKRIATQARYDANQWVTSYTVSYSNNGVRFFPYKQSRRTKVRQFHCLSSSHFDGQFPLLSAEASFIFIFVAEKGREKKKARGGWGEGIEGAQWMLGRKKALPIVPWVPPRKREGNFHV